MRIKGATIAVALLALVATPAALAKGSVTIGGGITASLQGLHGHWKAITVARTQKDRLHSCQAGDHRSNVRVPGPAVARETERKAATVACEQPPRGNLNLSSGMKSAEASALIAAG